MCLAISWPPPIGMMRATADRQRAMRNARRYEMRRQQPPSREAWAEQEPKESCQKIRSTRIEYQQQHHAVLDCIAANSKVFPRRYPTWQLKSFCAIVTCRFRSRLTSADTWVRSANRGPSPIRVVRTDRQNLPFVPQLVPRTERCEWRSYC